MAELKRLSGGDLKPTVKKPHVVLIGAGASRAAFHQGDAAGQRLPLMADLVETLGLESTLKNAGAEYIG